MMSLTVLGLEPLLHDTGQ